MKILVSRSTSNPNSKRHKMLPDHDMLDPLTLQSGTDIVNLRIGMDIDDWNARISIWERNITDERSYHGSFDQPLGAVRMNSYPTELATYGMSFTKIWD